MSIALTSSWKELGWPSSENNQIHSDLIFFYCEVPQKDKYLFVYYFFKCSLFLHL